MSDSFADVVGLLVERDDDREAAATGQRFGLAVSNTWGSTCVPSLLWSTRGDPEHVERLMSAISVASGW